MKNLRNRRICKLKLRLGFISTAVHFDGRSFQRPFISTDSNPDLSQWGRKGGRRKKTEKTPPLEKPPRRKSPGENPPGLFCEAEGRVDPISVQSSTRPSALSNFARASKRKNEEAKGRGGLPFTSYDYVHHLVSGQSLGLGS